MANKTIPIFFSIDDSYAPFLSVALKSAIDNSKSENNYRAIVMFESLSQDNRERLGGLATDNFKIDFVEMNEGLETITDRLSNRIRSEYFTLTIYFRLFIASMFPEYDKAIYIDSDIVLEEDIAELFSIDGIEPFQSYVEQVVGVDRNDYVNSGVLLMNLKRLRDADFDKHFLFLLNTYHFDSVAPDQDYLNAICKGSIYYLSPKWNAMPNEQKPKIEGAKLIHYNLFSKPWCYDGLQYGERFWHYAENSGYINEIREFKNNFTEDNQKEEMEILGNMLRRAEEIKGHDITLKKVGESGVKVRL